MNTENSKKLKNPKAWKHTEPITLAQLKQMRDEFWDTAPHYGGQKGTSIIKAKLNGTNSSVDAHLLLLQCDVVISPIRMQVIGASV
jgi:hypothetical protein